MAYTRSTAIDSAPSGDTTKQAVLDLDTDLTGIFADLNTHEALTTNAHGFTGTKTGSGAMVGATSPTIVTPTLTGAIGMSGGTFAVGSDADGDMYYRASSLLTRLAKGAANLKLFMNAGATAPEWAEGMKYGLISRAMDGATADVSTTGVGFKPSLIFFIAGGPGTIKSYGCGGAGTNYDLYWTSAVDSTVNVGCIDAYESAGKIQSATVKTLDADGFTLAWVRTGATASGTLNILYLALR